MLMKYILTFALMTEGKHENPGHVDRYRDLSTGPPEYEPVCHHCVTSLGILQGASKICAIIVTYSYLCYMEPKNPNNVFSYFDI